MNKICLLFLAILFSTKAISQNPAVLTVLKGTETATHVDMIFSLNVQPNITFFSCNFQIAHGDLTQPKQVAVTTPSADYTTTVTTGGGLVLNCVVEDLPKAIAVGPISWTVRFKKGTAESVKFALGGINECLDIGEKNYPAVIKEPSVEIVNTPNKITIKPYPNPTRNLIAIDKFKAFKTMNIYNAQGVLLLISNKTEADVSAFSAGTYIMEVVDTDGDRTQVKFVKQQ